MKKGCIKIQRTTYDNSWHIVSKVFEQFKPFHIELRREIDAWVFTGTCDSFDEVAEHEPAPEYKVTVKYQSPKTYHTADGLHVSFDRAEPPQYKEPGLMPLAMQIIKDELQKNGTNNTTYHTWKVAIQAAIMDAFALTNHTRTHQDIANEAADKAIQNIIEPK